MLAQQLRYLFSRPLQPGSLTDVHSGALFDKFLEDLGPGDDNQNILLSLCTGSSACKYSVLTSVTDSINITRKGTYSVGLATLTVNNFAPRFFSSTYACTH